MTEEEDRSGTAMGERVGRREGGNFKTRACGFGSCARRRASDASSERRGR